MQFFSDLIAFAWIVLRSCGWKCGCMKGITFCLVLS